MWKKTITLHGEMQVDYHGILIYGAHCSKIPLYRAAGHLQTNMAIGKIYLQFYCIQMGNSLISFICSSKILLVQVECSVPSNKPFDTFF